MHLKATVSYITITWLNIQDQSLWNFDKETLFYNPSVCRPLHFAGLWLLWHHQGNRPQESHRPDPTARLHWGDPWKHWYKSEWMFAQILFCCPRSLFLRWIWFRVLCLPSRRSTLPQRTGFTKKPGFCFWSQRWWIALQWSWSGVSLMRRDWSSSCAPRNSSGELNIDS